MPGILPMKVIKVGSNAQSRIAQACDRCRSKKIRCDGVRPCCTQCANVGFECKTSDKLSRRAFPRGYTESLEERVRQLEAEVRELKDLVDEKEEKIEVLSKMHDNRRQSAASSTPATSPESRASPPATSKEDIFRIQTSPLLLSTKDASQDAFFKGNSSGRSFVDALKRKIQENGKSCAPFNMNAFFQEQRSVNAGPYSSKPHAVPARLFSDKCVNVFFQEWSPLFPVLHKPTFLRTYEIYVNKPQEVVDKHQLAQLHLVFSLAGLSHDNNDVTQITACEAEWTSALEAVMTENSLSTLQCLVLAMLYCIAKADYERLLYYKGIAVGLSHRLGLHQTQKRFSFGALSTETRKRVFWTLYMIDCFSAALLGLPKLLKEDDIETEYPIDIDDEYVTERGFQPTLPGEYTKISSSLALLRACRIMSNVLDQLYPAASSYDLSLQSVSNLDQQLNDWFTSLPAHLKLTFAQDKPSTDITGNRSAFLSLTYYYVRTLIHRPVVGSSLGSKGSASVLCVGDSSKHIIQIVQLLRERNMSFSFCLNKNELLILCGLSILYQCLDLKQDSKMAKDGQRLMGDVGKLLEENHSPAAADFTSLIISVMVGPSASPSSGVSPTQRPASIHSRPSSSSLEQDSPQSSRRSLDSCHPDRNRRATMPAFNATPERRPSQQSSPLDRRSDESVLSKRQHRSSMPAANPLIRPNLAANTSPGSRPNLDYFPLNAGPGNKISAQKSGKLETGQLSEWESILGSLDGGQTNIYDAMYGGPALSLGHSQPSSTLNTPELSELPLNVDSQSLPNQFEDWAPDTWGLSFGNLQLNAIAPASDLSLSCDMIAAQRNSTRSVLSFSDESLSSGQEEFHGDLTHVDFANGQQYAIDANFGL